jgi:biopolymer transport protein TolR
MIPRRTRKAMNQINVVPYIDVMLVLLVIFMVTAPFISPTVVELPSVSKSAQAPTAPLELLILADGGMLLRDRAVNEEGEPVTEERLEAAVRARLASNPTQPVVISADRGVRYDSVMRAMDILQTMGVARVGLLTKPTQP